jgi:hypothetical protein
MIIILQMIYNKYRLNLHNLLIDTINGLTILEGTERLSKRIIPGPPKLRRHQNVQLCNNCMNIIGEMDAYDIYHTCTI